MVGDLAKPRGDMLAEERPDMSSDRALRLMQREPLIRIGRLRLLQRWTEGYHLSINAVDQLACLDLGIPARPTAIFQMRRFAEHGPRPCGQRLARNFRLRGVQF